MHNDFGDELRDMVRRVRAVYSGRLTYDMQPLALLHADHYGIGSGAGHLWEDLDLDIVGVSGWPPLTETAPTAVMSVRELEAAYEEVFRTYLVPLAGRNPGRALVFTEYHAMDVVEAPADTANGARAGSPGSSPTPTATGSTTAKRPRPTSSRPSSIPPNATRAS